MKFSLLLLILYIPILVSADEYPRDSNKKAIDSVINHSKQYIGKVGYKWGGTSLKKGIDCSAFVREMLKPYINLPRTTNQQVIKKGRLEVPRVDWVKKGDLIYFKFEDKKTWKKVDHVGIYIGDNKFIHSSSSLKGVKISKLTGKWKRNIMRIVRFTLN